MEPENLSSTNNFHGNGPTSRFTSTNQYLIFKNYINNHSKHCTLDMSILNTLTKLGSKPETPYYAIPQAICNPHNLSTEELLGFLDTESYSENTSDSSVTLNPYLLICNLNNEIMTYDIVAHGNNFIKRFLLDLIRKFNNDLTKNTAFIIAHNFSGHDSLLLISSFTSLISEKRCNCSVVYHSGNIYNLTIKWKNSVNTPITIRFQCSLILFQSSLEKVSNSFDNNLQKFPIPHNAVDSVNTLNSTNMSSLLDHLHSETEKNMLLEKWDSTKSKTIIDYANNYCNNDVELLEYIYTSFKSEYENAMISVNMSNYDFITISRLAQTTWSSNIDFNEQVIPNISNSSDIGKYLMEAYYGGKCEVYNGFLDPGTICYYFDYPGIYSIAMRQPLPVGVPVHVDCTSVQSPHFFISALHKSGMCAYLTVNFNTPHNCQIPILPYKASLSDSIPNLMFCNGKARGTYFSYELEHAINNGYIINKIYHGYVFNAHNTLNPYSNYMTQINEVSNTNNDSVRTLIYKLLANSLYGNFGMQRQSRSLFAPINSVGSMQSLSQFYPIDDQISIACVHIRDTSSATNVAIAASVASWGRIILSSGVTNVLRNNPGSKLIYVDTDSIFFQSSSNISCSKIWNNLNWTTQATYNDVNFLASKFYALKTIENNVIININGVNPDYITLDSFQNVSSENFNVLVNNIEQWKNATLNSITIKSTDNLITPYDSPNRQLVINDGNWTGNTLPYSFISVAPRQHTNFANFPTYSNPPTNFNITQNIQSTPSPAGTSYHLDGMSLHPARPNIGSINDYLVSYQEDIIDWSVLYHLIGWLSENLMANRVGVLSISDSPGTEITLTPEYFSYPIPYNLIGSKQFELYINDQVIYYAERYSLNSQETLQMLTESMVSVRFLSHYVS